MCVYPSDILSQEGIPIQFLQRTSYSKETSQEDDNEESFHTCKTSLTMDDSHNTFDSGE